MKPKQIFWGVLFLFLGGFLLLNNLFDFTLSLPELTKLWPLVLILIGISVILKNNTTKIILAALSAILIASILFSIFSRNFNWFHGKKHKHTFTVEKYDIPYDSTIKVMSLKFKSGVGRFNFTNLENNDALLKLNSSTSGSNFKIKTDTEGDSLNAKIELEDIDIEFGDNDDHHFENEIELNNNLIYDVQLGIGAASVEGDFELLKVRSLKLETGASDVRMEFGELYDDDVNIEISAGAASIRLKVPESVGVQIKSDLSLSSYDFEDMKEVTKDKFQTENFSEAEKKFFIKIKGGVSNIDVNRK